jgi:hypothetical protein
MLKQGIDCGKDPPAWSCTLLAAWSSSAACSLEGWVCGAESGAAGQVMVLPESLDPFATFSAGLTSSPHLKEPVCPCNQPH